MMMMTYRFLLAAALALSTASAALAQGAAKPTQVGTFNDWSVWSYTGSYNGTGQGKVCYLYSEPSEMRPPKLDHGSVSFSLTSSPSQGVRYQANFVTGYQLKEQSPVTIDIDGNKFTMFTQGDSAWLLATPEELDAKEAELLAAMKAGRSMVISAVSRRGNKTTYNYSLSGVTAASDKLSEECRS